jgi:hypothetical protein
MITDSHRFELLASAVARRTVSVAASAADSAGSVAGEGAWTDGMTIYLDPAADQVVAVAVQASMLAAGSLEPDVVRRLAGRPALARRYLAVEGHRALAANSYLLPPRARSLIDRDLVARTDSPAASLAAALRREPVPDPPRSFGRINPKRLLATRDRVVVGTAETAFERRARRDPQREHDEDADSDGGVTLEFFSNSAGGRGALAWLFERMLRLGRDPAKGGGPLGAGASARVRHGRTAGRGGMPTTGAAAALADLPAKPGAAARQHGKAYPEWDVYRKRYRPGWCTVRDVDPRPGDDAGLAVPDVHALRRPLARLGMGLDHCRRQFAGDDIDIDAAVEARVDARTGAPRDQPVYVATLRRRRDLAVLILLDISASAAELGTAGPGAGGRTTVHEQQRAAAAMLTTALHGLGDRVALYGFHSQGRTAVRLVRVKGFDDDLGTLAMRRLGGLVPGAYTRLGAAIRHGAAMLEEGGGTSRRLLVVLSDGLAYDHGYEGPYGEADSRRALAEARRRGTGCLCLSVGAGTDLASLRRVFGTAAYASVARPEQLSGVVGPLFRAALGSAELRRLRSQRELRGRTRVTVERRTA